MASKRGSKSNGSTPKPNVNLTVGIVGDGGVGKTCLLLTYLSGKCPAEYMPGPADWHSEYDHLTRHPVKLEQNGVQVSMNMVDTCGLDEYQKLREKVCSSVDVFLLCFDVTSFASLERVRDQWVPEVKEYNSSAAFVLVATKCDERIKAQMEGKPTSATVSFAQAKAAAQEMGAHTYCETSAKNKTGLKKVFEEAATAGVKNALPSKTGDEQNGCVVS